MTGTPEPDIQLAVTCVVTHERAVRAAWAVAAAVEDAPTPTTLTQLASLRTVVWRLGELLYHLDVPEPVATKPGEGG